MEETNKERKEERKKEKKKERNSRKSVKWSAVPVAPMQCECMWMCDSERGSGPEGANDLCLVGFGALGLNWASIMDTSLKAVI